MDTPAYTLDELTERQVRTLATMARCCINYYEGYNGAVSIYGEGLHWGAVKALASRKIIWVTGVFGEEENAEVMIRREYLALAEECRRRVEGES